MKTYFLFFIFFSLSFITKAQTEFNLRNDSLFYKTEFWFKVKHKVNASGGYKYILIDNEKKVQGDFTVAAQNDYLFLCDVILPEVQKSFNSTFLSEKKEMHLDFFLGFLDDLYKNEVLQNKTINVEKLTEYCKAQTLYLSKFSKAAYYITYPVE